MKTSNPSDVKRQQLLDFTLSQLAPQEAVRGVVAVGSVATGHARADSDIDAIVFMEPLDAYVCPAEFVWRSRDNTFHSILSDDPSLDREGIQFDPHRLELGVWQSPSHEWPEARRAELAEGWIAYDPSGQLRRMIDDRTRMSPGQRLAALDEVMTQAAFLIPHDDSADHWDRLGPAEALDRLQTGYEELCHGLFAYHWRWRPWRSRRLRGLLRLSWLPAAVGDDLPTVVGAPGHHFEAYAKRAAVLRASLDELIARLISGGTYRHDPDDEGFRRLNDEPGRAWNMDEWHAERDRRVADRGGHRPE